MSKDLFLARYGSAKHIDTLLASNPSAATRDNIMENPFASDAHVQSIFDRDKDYRAHSHVIRSILNRDVIPNGIHEHIVKHNYDGNIFKKAIATANKQQLDHIAKHTSYNGAGKILDKIVEHPLADDTTYHNLMANKHSHIVRHFMDDEDIKPEHLETVYHNQPDHGIQGFAISNEKAPASILKHAAEHHPVEYIRKIAAEHPNYPHPK